MLVCLRGGEEEALKRVERKIERLESRRGGLEVMICCRLQSKLYINFAENTPLEDFRSLPWRPSHRSAPCLRFLHSLDSVVFSATWARMSF